MVSTRTNDSQPTEPGIASGPEIHRLLRLRWSPTSFSDRLVEAEKLRTIFEAACWAPSSFNEQPWSFVVATKENQGEYNQLLSILSGRNKQWAHQAPVLILSVAKVGFGRNGTPNRYAFHDVGQAVANMTVQANALGLAVHQMGGFDGEKARELLNIPAGYEPVAVMAVGHLVDGDILTAQPPVGRNRKPLDGFVFTGEWGHTSPLVID